MAKFNSKSLLIATFVVIGLVGFCITNLRTRIAPEGCVRSEDSLVLCDISVLSEAFIDSSRGWPYAFQIDSSGGITGGSWQEMDYSNLVIDLGVWLFGAAGMSALGIFILSKTKSKK